MSQCTASTKRICVQNNQSSTVVFHDVMKIPYDTKFWCHSAMTLTIELWPCFKVMKTCLVRRSFYVMPFRAPGLTSGLQGSVVLYCWCHSNSASVLLYFTWNFAWKCHYNLLQKYNTKVYRDLDLSVLSLCQDSCWPLSTKRIHVLVPTSKYLLKYNPDHEIPMCLKYCSTARGTLIMM